MSCIMTDVELYICDPGAQTSCEVIHAWSERWINHISINVWFGQYVKIWNLRVQKLLNIEKIIFKVVLKQCILLINN